MLVRSPIFQNLVLFHLMNHHSNDVNLKVSIQYSQNQTIPHAGPQSYFSKFSFVSFNESSLQ